MAARQIKVSVIIPVYNMGIYLEQCLKSIQNQTLKEIEIICVDDGSTDQTLELLNEVAQQNEKIKVFTQQNQGAGVARNRGIVEARGQFVAFMDADDKYPNQTVLALLYQKAVESKTNIAGGSFREFAIGYENAEYDGIASGYHFEQEKIMTYREYQFDFGYHRFIYHREFLLKNNIQFPPYRRFQDPPFFVKAMLVAKQFYAVPDVTYCYRVAHKKIAWTEQQVNDLLQGLLDNLQLARENQLEKLYWITLKRIQGDYQDILLSACYQGNNDIENYILKLEQLLSKEWLRSNGKVLFYWDMKRIIKVALHYCATRTTRKSVGKFAVIKKLLNGSYVDLNGVIVLRKSLKRRLLKR